MRFQERRSASGRRSSHADSELLDFVAAYEVNTDVFFRVVVKVAPSVEFALDDTARPRTKHNPPLSLTVCTHG